MPFETECHHCNRSFKLKDELLGKKFKCSDCGAVVVAEAILPAVPVEPPPVPQRPVAKRRGSSASAPRKATRQRSTELGPSEKSARRSSKAPAPKKRRRSRSQEDDLFSGDGGGGGAYDAYDDYSNDFGDVEDQNPYSESYGSSSAPQRSSKNGGRAKSSSRRKQQSGSGVGFNVNRLNLAMAGIALAIGFYALRESRLAAKAGAEPTTISMSDLIANGQPDNIYVTVTDVSAEVEEYVYEFRGTDESRYTKVFIPCRARSQNDQNVGMVLFSSSLHSDSEVSPLGRRRELTGMIVNDIRSFDSEEKGLLSSIPGVRVGSALIFELDRKPTSAGVLFAMFGLSGAMLLGSLGWMFLTGSPDAAPVRSNPSRSSSASKRAVKSRSVKPARLQGRSQGPLSATDLLFSFEGRVNRGQFILTNVLASFAFLIGTVATGAILPEKAFIIVYVLALMPATFSSFAMAAKRAHDFGHSGWINLLLFIPLANLIWGVLLLFSAGNEGSNDYGYPPA